MGKKQFCNCGGELSKKGCKKYLDSEAYKLAVKIESGMRSGGLGSAVLCGVDATVMTMHLQDNGMTLGEITEVLAY
ncbi:MAG: hypothetical protein R3346_04110 [Candidatus Spechtbacterales bacterium]|nr:hypothetical protein [Candidatus Spechtbacterales bacterium]